MTLVEVLAALVVLSIGLIALISVLPLASSSVREGASRSDATFLALDRLEEVRQAIGPAEASSDSVAAGFPDEPSLPPPHAVFGRSVRVRDCGLEAGCSGVQSPGLRQITVTVTYPATVYSGVGSAHRAAVVLSTYILRSAPIGPR